MANALHEHAFITVSAFTVHGMRTDGTQITQCDLSSAVPVQLGNIQVPISKCYALIQYFLISAR